MEIIHANENFEDINQIRSIRDFDAEISLYGNSDYKLTLPTRAYEKYPIESPNKKLIISSIPALIHLKVSGEK